MNLLINGTSHTADQACRLLDSVSSASSVSRPSSATVAISFRGAIDIDRRGIAVSRRVCYAPPIG